MTAKDSLLAATQMVIVGQHTRCLPYYQNDCYYHKEHTWSLEEEFAQQECAKCHFYKSPASLFIPTKKFEGKRDA
jgi:hypothetical protein